MGFDGIAASFSTAVLSNAQGFLTDFDVFIAVVAGLFLFALALNIIYRTVR